MVEIDPRQLADLEWHQDSTFGRRHTLKSGDSVLAEIHFQKTLGTLAEARTARSAWTYKRRGIFTASIGARVAGEQIEIATYQPNWTAHKGLVRFDDGEEFQLRASNLWASEWTLTGADGSLLLRYHNSGFLRHGARVDVEPAARKHPRLELLLTLTYYILLLHQMDGAAA